MFYYNQFHSKCIVIHINFKINVKTHKEYYASKSTRLIYQISTYTNNIYCLTKYIIKVFNCDDKKMEECVHGCSS